MQIKMNKKKIIEKIGSFFRKLSESFTPPTIGTPVPVPAVVRPVSRF